MSMERWVGSSTLGGRVGEDFEWSDPDFTSAPADTCVIVVDQAFCRSQQVALLGCASQKSGTTYCLDVARWTRQLYTQLPL